MKSSTLLAEFLNSWWMVHWIKNYGENKPVWPNGPTVEELRACEGKDVPRKYVDLLSSYLDHISHCFSRGKRDDLPTLFESVG